MGDSRPIVSAIMPVYKTPESFLRASIESVLNQTVRNTELILVDDGSPDNCGAICDEYAAADKRIVVIHQQNQGPSIARNTGIRAAKGRFLTFIDSDDALVSDAWERTLKVFEHSDVDCAVFGWVDFTPEGAGDIHRVADEYSEITASEALCQIASDNYCCGGGYPWNKIWRTDSLIRIRGHIPTFSEELYTYEDKLWIIEALSGLNKVALLPDILYEYRFLATSLTQDSAAWAKRQFNAYEAYDKICDTLQHNDRRAYEGALSFYFTFCKKDMETTKEDRWRDEGRYQRTKRRFMSLCHRIALGELHSLKYTLIWIWYWILGLFYRVDRRPYMPDPGYANAPGLRGREFFIDLLRALASFCVVWEHFGNEVLWYDGSLAWKMCVPIQVLCFWAVPAFFMLTGATCMTYRRKHSTLGFYKRRVTKILVPYIIWATVALFINVGRGAIELAPGDWGKLANALSLYASGGVESIYWFFIPLFAIYMAMPVYSLLSKRENRPALRYTLALGTITVCFLPFIVDLFAESFNLKVVWNGSWTLPAVGGYAIYALVGYWAITHDFSRIQRWMCYLNGVFCLALHMIGIYVLSPRLGYVPGVFKNYLGYHAFGVALAVFVACRYLRWENIFRPAILRRIISKLGECSFGVYLMHIFVLRWMEVRPVFAKYTPFWYFVCPVLCYVFCVAVVYAVRKIPVVKRIFP